jgi:hypothetical protein
MKVKVPWEKQMLCWKLCIRVVFSEFTIEIRKCGRKLGWTFVYLEINMCES